MSWVRSGTELSQFLRVFLPAFGYGRVRLWLQILHMDISIYYTALPHHSLPILIPYTDNPILPISSGQMYSKSRLLCDRVCNGVRKLSYKYGCSRLFYLQIR